MPLKLKAMKVEINAVVFKITIEFEPKQKRQTRPRRKATKLKNKAS